MIIETVDDKIPTFQVIFRKPKGVKTKYEYELSPESYTCETYLQEYIYVKDHHVVFELSSFGITQKDYLFSFADHGRTPSVKNIVCWSYNLMSGQFTCNKMDDSEHNDIISFAHSINLYRKMDGIHYIDTLIYNEFMNSLVDAMNALGLSETRKQMIAYIFKNTLHRHDESMFVRLVVALQSVV